MAEVRGSSPLGSTSFSPAERQKTEGSVPNGQALAEEQSCELCGARFRVEGVYAWAANVAMSGSDPNQAACPSCIAYFGRRNPEQFPTIEEYEEAARRYPMPILAGEEEMRRLDDNTFFDVVYEAATLSRGDLETA